MVTSSIISGLIFLGAILITLIFQYCIRGKHEY
jgi:hypothetical protein